MRRGLRLCALGLWLGGCADKMERVLAREGDPVAGAEVWSTHCEKCHAADGSGTDMGPNLTDDEDTPEQLADKILYGWGEMNGFEDTLSVQETADVIAYVEQNVLLP